MKRFILGFIAGALLAAAPGAWAGFYYSATSLIRERGGPCEEVLFLGYVAGVHDVMAAPYPVTRHRLGTVTNAARERMMVNPGPDSLPAAWSVVGTLKEQGLITTDDITRVFPAGWLK